jgi:hypothetical protein
VEVSLGIVYRHAHELMPIKRQFPDTNTSLPPAQRSSAIPPSADPDPINAVDIFLQVAAAFNSVLGHGSAVVAHQVSVSSGASNAMIPPVAAGSSEPSYPHQPDDPLPLLEHADAVSCEISLRPRWQRCSQ